MLLKDIETNVTEYTSQTHDKIVINLKFSKKCSLGLGGIDVNRSLKYLWKLLEKL